MATTNHSTAVSDLVDSLRRAHQLCETTGNNLPELLREALEQLATNWAVPNSWSGIVRAAGKRKL